uniref:Multidrug and toxin extrusion protein n=1 Tax=Oryzias sinensis TaxID=183150 RepID=A0A8C7Z4N9_9TELE
MKTNASLEKSSLAPGAADMEGPSDRLFRCRWVRNKVPVAHREELYHILRMTGPLLLARILHYLLPFVVTMFCGRLGNNVMAGYGLASATLNVTSAATGFGLALACDTLVSQTFGGRNLLRVGIILQRGIIILLLFCLPCWGLLINAQAVLDQLQTLYLCNDLEQTGIIMPQMYAAALANIANVATNYIFIYWLQLGVVGSAAANTLSQVYICVFLFGYIWWKKLHATTWGGWSVESLQEWGSYMKLAIPSTLMTCFEWWVYEFGGFFAGMLSEEELAAQHAVIMVAFLTYMFPLGIQAAACARVGNALGAGDTARAILSSKISLALAGCFAIVEGIVLGSTKTVIGFIFTSDERIVGLVSHLINAYCFLQFFDGLVCVCTGIFLGTGKQKIPAVAHLIGYYCIGLPLCVTLMFVAKLRVLGFWIGLLICVILQSTFYIVVIFKLNWKKMTEEVFLKTKILCGTCAKCRSGCVTQPLVKSPLQNIKMYSVEGYVPVTTENNDGKLEEPERHVVLKQRRDNLSTSQLILRRGITVIAALGLLGVGIIVHFLVPLPETQFAKANTTEGWINTTYAPSQYFSTVQ